MDVIYSLFVFLQDPVLNVRLKFCTIPPRLKSLLKLPSDRHLLQQLEQCIRKLLSSEKEPDVSNAVREASSFNQYVRFYSLTTNTTWAKLTKDNISFNGLDL